MCIIHSYLQTRKRLFKVASKDLRWKISNVEMFENQHMIYIRMIVFTSCRIYSYTETKNLLWQKLVQVQMMEVWLKLWPFLSDILNRAKPNTFTQ